MILVLIDIEFDNGATGGTSVHGLQAAFDQTLNQSSGTLQIRATKIAKVTTI